MCVCVHVQSEPENAEARDLRWTVLLMFPVVLLLLVLGGGGASSVLREVCMEVCESTSIRGVGSV
jgi:hypothetical protein